VIAFIISLSLWGLSFCFGEDELLVGLCWQWSQSFFTLALFLEIPYKKQMYKFAAFAWMIASFSNDMIEPMLEWFSISCYGVYLIIFYVAAISVMYSLFRSYRIPNDKYTGKGVYVIFKRPKHFRGFVLSFFSRPISSVSVVVNDDWYMFKKEEKFFFYRKYVQESRHGIMKINIPEDKAYNWLNSMNGKDWSYKRNCCHVVQELLPIEFSPLDSIPCILLKTMEKLKKDGSI